MQNKIHLQRKNLIVGEVRKYFLTLIYISEGEQRILVPDSLKPAQFMIISVYISNAYLLYNFKKPNYFIFIYLNM